MQKSHINQFLQAKITNIEAPFLHINHLLANTKAVNRPKDQLDVIYLEKLRQMQQNEQSGE
jgi:hypothetical protein